MDRLVELAETLQAPVIDKAARMNFPTRHPLNQSARSRALIAEADVILGLEVADFWSTVNAYHDQVHRSSQPIMKAGTKLISITSGDLYTKANYQDFYRYTAIDVAIAADAQATVPSLIEAIKRQLTAGSQESYPRPRYRVATGTPGVGWNRRATEATYGWGRLFGQRGASVRLSCGTRSRARTGRCRAGMWQCERVAATAVVIRQALPVHRLFRWRRGRLQRPGGRRRTALANRKHGRLSVNIQGDGDLLFGPAVLWTAGRTIASLCWTVMLNNRALS